MTREAYMNPDKMSENIKGKTLLTECKQICDSWGIAASIKLNGNRCTVNYSGGQFQCMRWDVMQRLNEIGVDQL